MLAYTWGSMMIAAGGPKPSEVQFSYPMGSGLLWTMGSQTVPERQSIVWMLQTSRQ